MDEAKPCQSSKCLEISVNKWKLAHDHVPTKQTHSHYTIHTHITDFV